jgi:hypothetical protein
MNPHTLIRDNFKAYPPEAQRVACDHLDLLRDLPTVLAAALLREVIDYDTRFPRERATIDARLVFLDRLSPEKRHQLTKGFADLSTSPELVAEDWVRFPQKFEEDLSAHFWASKQQDAFRAAAMEFAEEVGKATPPSRPPVARWSVVAIGPELRKDGYPLFRNLRPHGVFYPQVDGAGGMEAILAQLSARASATRLPYGHWYVDGGSPEPNIPPSVSQFSWQGSTSLRAEVLKKVETVIGSGSGGPEMLRSIMANWALEPRNAQTGDPLADQFVMSVYGVGSGTQIFSTTFVQWSARELLRRAEPVSLVARFGPRQKQRAMNEMFLLATSETAPDFAGSLVDADFAAFYTWINLSRLTNPEPARFIAWSEAHRQAIAIGPDCPRGTEAPNHTALVELLQG